MKTKIELKEILGGIPDQITKKYICSILRIQEFKLGGNSWRW